MNYRDIYNRWRECARETDLAEELLAVETDEDAIKERFCSELAFGTAGLRGIIGAGPNRMNVYTVRRATQGLADTVSARYGTGAIAIAYDSRNKSREFARECARVLAANGLTAYIYDRLMPTPMLSFAVRELRAKAGIMITASHNPAQYNGYKAYGADGCQMTSEDADAVYARIQKVDVFDGVRLMPFDDGQDKGFIKYIDRQIIERYYDCVKAQRINPDIC
ncbi:MAG: phospho-sugar mutase, partial [Oscillospiraceae bacterium]